MTNPHEGRIDFTAVRQTPLGPAAAPVPQAVPYPPPYVTPTPAAPPGRRRRTLLWLIAVAVVLLVGGAVTMGALTYFGRTPLAVPGISHFDAHGTLVVSHPCGGLGYEDIRAGTEVTVTDEAGKVVAVGQLEPGAAGSCSYTFTLKSVPAGARFYGVTISHRGTLHYTEQQLRAGIDLSLG